MDCCFMCKRSGESADHLLLHCEVSRALWDEVFAKLGIAWVMPKSVVNLLACWKGVQRNHQIVAVWKMVPLCLMCCIWNEWNGCCFDNRECSVDGVRAFFFHSLLLWDSVFLMDGFSPNEFRAVFQF
ncbi:hypothetical protein I3760_11G096400 [Carya illinoinensis]|uniref:Reverse transcriptase zinc-binding domain-containing protein n=1 Tax=Carya illinoinensis TaxID=32201 RepID=A0A922DPD4_CARIL|nr:hypothetical protein I3760_11G096400 [Carya illinoinensis]KAG6687917.1 hypothetical protein I3842_11G098200 [Carya illinoinensis]